MKTDIDTLMQENKIDAILITGPAQHNPFMYYLTGGGHITKADLIKVPGKTPTIFHGPMERDEAAKTGLITRSYSIYPWGELLEEAGQDSFKALILRYARMFADAGVTQGRVALYGQTDLGHGVAVIESLQEKLPQLEFVGYLEKDIIRQAMATKEESEVERIKKVGLITVEVVDRVAEFLKSHDVEEQTLVKADGNPLTIGDVKARINLWLAELGTENPHGTIFAIGRDAGVPHSTGTASDRLALGKTIVFDIFPCEAGGGYHYDFTRTWCLGYAPDEVVEIYEQVYQVYDKVTAELKSGELFSRYQKLTCDLYESMGHPTIQSQPETEKGYVHSLGHGLGLHVHEVPFCGKNTTDMLAPGSVFTIEPGLYYPEQGIGVRLEDTYWINGNGTVAPIVTYPMDLVLPMKS